MATISAQEFLKGGKKAQLVVPASSNFGVDKGFFKEASEDIRQTFGALKETVTRTKEKIQDIATAEVSGEQGGTRSFGQAFGTVAGGVSRGVGDILTGLVKTALPQRQEEQLKAGLQSSLETIAPIGVKIDEALGSPVGTFVSQYKKLDEKSKRDIDALLGISSLAVDIATLGTTKKVGEIGAREAEKVAEQVLTRGEQAIKRGGEFVGEATEKLIKAPSPTPLQAAGQVLQGETSDIAQGIRGLSQIDTTGIKTFKELGTKMAGRITELAQQVDADLALDTTKKVLKDLVLTGKTTGGKIIKTRPVELALNQLSELYTKIGDRVRAADVKELIQLAKNQGLTNLEINNIARVYGQEFAQKAFNKMGDALTSVNAQLYENTRKALKNLARSGIKGEAAKMADQAMNTLYDTQRLIQKNVEAVNKLRQKIAERGLLEKFGYLIAKYGDLLTGGSIRGFVGGLLPRGAGYKVMNALDIETALEKNLKILQDAIKGGSDKEIETILKKLNLGKQPDELYAVAAGVEPQYDEQGNLKGFSINPLKAGLGILGTKIVGKGRALAGGKHFFKVSEDPLIKGLQSELNDILLDLRGQGESEEIMRLIVEMNENPKLAKRANDVIRRYHRTLKVQ